MKNAWLFSVSLLLLLYVGCEDNSTEALTDGYLQGKVTIDAQGVDGVIIDVSVFQVSGGQTQAKAVILQATTGAGDYSIKLSAGDYRADYAYYGYNDEVLQTARYPITITPEDTMVIDVELKDPVPHSVMVADGNAAVEISWESSYGAVSYNVYRADSSAENFAIVAEVDTVSGTVYHIDQPPAAGFYNYYVTAIDVDGQESDYEGIKQVEFTAAIQTPFGLHAIDMVDYVELAWQENIRADHYKIYRSTANNQDWSLVDSTYHTELENEPPDFAVYYYRVTAVSGYDTESAPSIAVSVDFDGRFDPPRELAIVDRGSSLLLTWSGYENAAYYSIYRSAGSDQDFLQIDTTGSAFYSDSPVDSGTYYYYVTATAFNGLESGPSAIVSSAYDGVLDYPDNFSAIDRGLFVELGWDEVPWAGAYRLFRSNNGDVYFEIARIDGSITSYNDTPINEGLYYYRIATETITGELGELCDPVSCEFSDNLLPPENINAASAGTYITISWDDVMGAIGYKIYRSHTEGGSYEYVDSTLETSFIDIPSIAGDYYYKIRSFDSAGHISDFSQSAHVYFADMPMPPFNIDAVDSLYKVALWWESYESEADYMLYRAPNMYGNYQHITTVSEMMATDYPPAEEDYFYKLRTIANNDTSELSEYVFVLFSGLLDAPDDLIAFDAGTHVQLQWDAPQGATRYEVYRSDAIDGEFQRLETVYHNNASDAPDEAGVYYYKVKAFTEGGLPSPFSNIAQVEFAP